MSLPDLLLTPEGREQLRSLLLGFDGRIGRGQYWLAWLAWIVISILLYVVFFLTSWLPTILTSADVMPGTIGFISSTTPPVRPAATSNAGSTSELVHASWAPSPSKVERRRRRNAW